ncbi:chemotaxis protein [Epibacterium ulvae]|uniref:methyl-accepting chemotaxis protein n=1 Tax=Epibacterium ulvae TaxID=1156985 RepID=UPI001BFC5462|nr:methyl-accepting chemotaxis protein [Epibacterium ulvae]MBT8154062.1 chemotaxis protein [Epibacterium ulvae]
MNNLTEIQNTAFTAIGPCRIAALSLMALMNEGAENAKAAEIFKLSAKRLETAHKMLTIGLPDLLKSADHDFPPLVQEQLDQSVAALTPLINTIRNADEQVANLPKPSEKFSEHCLYVLEPTVTQFLTDMTQNLLDTQKKKNQDREREMLDAISNAESVGRNIQLIAFNASIEAARIGDMGKGFAVIATEIRELSGKTQVLLDDIAGFLRT